MLNHKRNLAALTLALSVLVFLPGSHAQSSADKRLLAAMSAPSQVIVERTVDASDFVQDMADAAGKLRAYTFDYETLVFKGNKTIDQRGTFYFKQPPRMLRVEMTGSYKKGSVAVLGRDGKVRGHLGGALSPFTMTLDPNSDMLQGANGYPLVDSDFAGMSGVIKTFLQQGCKAKVSDHPVSVEGQTKKVYVLEIMKPNGTELYKRAYIDPQTMLPLEWFDYQDGHLFAHTIWRNLNMSANITDDTFKI
jgi:outer membrane lipoprotein-sorting protein